MTGPAEESGLRGGVRRALDGAFDATVGRVGQSVNEVAVEVTGATAEQVITEMEPFLVREALPRILEDLRPYLEAELVPAIVAGLMPHLNDSVAPDLIDGLMPKITDEVAPQLVESLMPMIETKVAPRLIEAMMPMIRDEVAPDLVDSLMPKIRAQVVPTILDDIVDDPAVRDLIREQSQGLFLDALEGFRRTLAGADTTVERIARGLVRRGPRPKPDAALELVLVHHSPQDTKPLRLEVEDLARIRDEWRALPLPPAPLGRSFSYGGPVTRGLGLAIDVATIGWAATQVLSTVIGLLEALVGTLPPWLVAVLSVFAASLVPIYLTVCFWAIGRTLGMAVTGLRVCTPDGRRPGFIRAAVRAWAEMVLLVVWLVTGFTTFFDVRRRTLLDMLTHTEVRYSVPEEQQRRRIREALQAEREGARRAAPAAAPGAPTTADSAPETGPERHPG